MRNVVVEVPYAYGLKGLAKGQRKERDLIRETSVTVGIAAPTEEEAPVALVWHRRVRWADEGAPDMHPPRDFRSFEGRLYRPIEIERRTGQPDAHVTVEHFLAAVSECEDGIRNPLDAGARRSWWDFGQKVEAAAAAGDGLRVVSSQEAAVAAEIRRKAGELILIDGRVYRQTAEPVYVVGTRHQGSFENPVGADVAFLDAIREPLDIATHFRADQLPDVLQTISGRTRRIECDFDVEEPASFRAAIPDWVEVRDAGVLTLRLDQGPKLIQAAQARIDFLGKHLAKEPLATLVAYANLRDALNGDAPAERIADLCTGLVEADPDKWYADGLREEVAKFGMAPTVEREPARAPAMRT